MTLIYGGPGKRSWELAPDPGIQTPTDIIVKMKTTTICGTDWHILKGDVRETTPGTILGDEGVGTVEEVGSGVGTRSRQRRGCQRRSTSETTRPTTSSAAPAISASASRFSRRPTTAANATAGNTGNLPILPRTRNEIGRAHV